METASSGLHTGPRSVLGRLRRQWDILTARAVVVAMIGSLVVGIGAGTILGEEHPVYLAFGWLVMVPVFYGGLVLLPAIALRNGRRRHRHRRQPGLLTRLDDLTSRWPRTVGRTVVLVAAAPFMLVFWGTFVVMAAVVIVVALPLAPIVLDLIDMSRRDDSS
jgi:hypothetical protein